MSPFLYLPHQMFFVFNIGNYVDELVMTIDAFRRGKMKENTKQQLLRKIMHCNVNTSQKEAVAPYDSKIKREF